MISLNPDPDLKKIQYDEVLNNALVEAHSGYIMNLKDIELKLTAAFRGLFCLLGSTECLGRVKGNQLVSPR